MKPFAGSTRRFVAAGLAVALAALAGVLLSRAAAEPAEGTISAEITYNGKPFTYATVTAVAQDGSSEYRGELASPDGGFAITAPAGAYNLVVAPFSRDGNPEFHQQNGVTVTAGATTTVNVTLQDGPEEPKSTLSRVVRFADGKPAAGVGVWWAGRQPQVTNNHGEWSAEDAAFGVYAVSLFYDGKIRATRFVTFGPGDTAQAVMTLSASVRPVQGSPAQNAGLAGTVRTDEGLSIYHCPGARDNQLRIPLMGRSASVRATASHTSWKGWLPDECLKMDKGPWHRRHTIVGINGVHNWLLGGYGTDTIIGGNDGDVIWSDYNPTGGPPFQVSYIHAGNGRNVIYANATRDYVWTGTNPHTVVHSHDDYASGVIHCQNPAIVVYLSVISERHYKLDGCHHISHYSVGH